MILYVCHDMDVTFSDDPANRSSRPSHSALATRCVRVPLLLRSSVWGPDNLEQWNTNSGTRLRGTRTRVGRLHSAIASLISDSELLVEILRLWSA